MSRGRSAGRTVHPYRIGRTGHLECAGRAGAATALLPAKGHEATNRVRRAKAVSRCACHRSPSLACAVRPPEQFAGQPMIAGKKLRRR